MQELYGLTSLPLRAVAYAEKVRVMVLSANPEEHHLEVVWEDDVKWLDRQHHVNTQCHHQRSRVFCPVGTTSCTSGFVRNCWGVSLRNVSTAAIGSGIWGDQMSLSEVCNVCLKVPDISRDDEETALATGAHDSTRRGSG